jgi:endonuclease V
MSCESTETILVHAAAVVCFYVGLQRQWRSRLCTTEAQLSSLARSLSPGEQSQRECWIKEQERLSLRLIQSDMFKWTLGAASSKHMIDSTEGVLTKPLRYIGGVDISFVKESATEACASLVVLEFPSLDVVYESYDRIQMSLPYISGFLAFREVDPLLKLVNRLRVDKPGLVPDIIMVDGNGVLHPRGFGLASHLGVLSNIPTIGIGKTFLHVDGLTERKVKHLARVRIPADGGSLLLQGDSGRIWGAAFRPNTSVQNPVYVSCGHGVSLATALAITTACSKHRVPEPVRQADSRSREVVRSWRA